MVRIKGHSPVPAGAVGFCKPSPQTQDHIGFGRQGMGEFHAPETGLSNHQRMGIADAALAHQGPGNRDVQEFCQGCQFV